MCMIGERRFEPTLYTWKIFHHEVSIVYAWRLECWSIMKLLHKLVIKRRKIEQFQIEIEMKNNSLKIMNKNTYN